MKRDDPTNGQEEALVMELSADILRGRQSVRATFRLPSQVISLLSVAADQLGLKQKSLFDQLVEDREVLEQLAQMADQYHPMQSRRQQKTYVVSRNALLALEHVAKACGLPRDLLVELSIQRLAPMLSLEQEKQGKRVELSEKLEALSQQGERLLRETVQLLGEDDPAVQILASFQAHCRRTASEMNQLVEQGKKLAQYQ